MNTYLSRLLTRLVDIDNKKDMLQLLEAILTPRELDVIPRRLEIIHRIKKGIPQSKIAKDLGVGIATITRGSKEAKRTLFTHV